MVTCIFYNLRFYLAVLGQAALLLYTTTIYASTAPAPAPIVQLAYGLEVTLPGSLALQVIAPHEQFKHPIIAGNINGEASYFIAATRINDWEKNALLWNRLENQIRRKSDRNEFTIRQRGSFSTTQNIAVFFRMYEYNTNNQQHRQVYFLLNNQRAGYWITLTMLEGADASLIIPIATALVRRAHMLN